MTAAKKYKVNEIFYSLQGEGRWTGRAAIFIRFSVCNLSCSFCDTDFAAFKEMTVDDILGEIARWSQCKFIVLTGGEPTLQADNALVGALHERGYYLSMETNGTHRVPEGIDWVTCSPKTAYISKAKVTLKHASELKVVYDGGHEVSDFGIEATYYYVQPCDVGDEKRNKEILGHAIEFVKNNPSWRLSLQTHKLLGIR